MPIIHQSVTFTPQTGLPRDAVVASFTFAGPGTALEVANTGVDSIRTFYNGTTAPVPAGVVGVSQWMGRYFPRTPGAIIRSYLMAVASESIPDTHVPPGFGSPIQMDTMPFLPFNHAGDLPEECAVCLSVHTDRGTAGEHSGPGPRLAERRRGRLFIGPLTALSVDADPATGAPRVSSGLLAELRNAFLRLVAQAAAAAVNYVLWSRKDNLVRPIIGGFIDNRFDSQRRRGELATNRSTFINGDTPT